MGIAQWVNASVDIPLYAWVRNQSLKGNLLPYTLNGSMHWVVSFLWYTAGILPGGVPENCQWTVTARKFISLNGPSMGKSL
jgi:hypothetical protein